MKRHSKKRQSIIECIKGSKEHPSAEWVYNKLKPKHPSLSLGTVYRNIRELEREGIISSVGIIGDKERFDGNGKEHFHVVCSKCGKIIDIDSVKLPESIIDEAVKSCNFSIERCELKFIGICEDCKKEEGK